MNPTVGEQLASSLGGSLGMAALLPEIFLGVAACFILIFDLFDDEEGHGMSYSLAGIALLGTMLLVIWRPYGAGHERHVRQRPDVARAQGRHFAREFWLLRVLQKVRLRSRPFSQRILCAGSLRGSRHDGDALASGILLYGMSIFYGLTGSLDLTTVHRSIGDIPLDNTVLAFGLVFIVVATCFKLGRTSITARPRRRRSFWAPRPRSLALPW